MLEKNNLELLPIVQELKEILEEKNMSPEIAAAFLYHCSSRQIRRWLEGSFNPSPLYQREIRKGINRLKRLK